jgi:hypothetical protein
MDIISATEARQKSNDFLQKSPITISQCAIAINDAVAKGERKVYLKGYRTEQLTDKLVELGYSYTRVNGDNGMDITISW